MCSNRSALWNALEASAIQTLFSFAPPPLLFLFFFNAVYNSAVLLSILMHRSDTVHPRLAFPIKTFL